MPLINGNNQARLPIGIPAIGGEKSGFVENREATANLSSLIERSDSQRITHTKVFDNLVKTIEQTTGEKFKHPYKDYPLDFGATENTNNSNALGIMESLNSTSQDRKKKIFDAIHSNEQLFLQYGDIDDNSITSLSKELVDSALKKQAEVAERQGVTGAIGEFVGNVKAVITDPVNIGAIGLDIAFTKGVASSALRSAFSNISRTAAREAFIGASSEVLIQTEVSDWYKTLDLPYTIDTFIQNVAYAGIGGAVLGGVAEGIVPAVQLTRKQLIKGVEVINKAKAKVNNVKYVPDDVIENIKIADEFDEAINSQNIILNDVGDLEHTKTINDTINAIDTGDFSKVIPKEEVQVARSVDAPNEDLNVFDDVDSIGYNEDYNIALKEIEDEIEARGDDFLNETIPTDVFDKNLNQDVPTNVTVKEIYEEIKADKSMITRMKECLL